VACGAADCLQFAPGLVERALRIELEITATGGYRQTIPWTAMTAGGN
jgi:hypothetical protein